LDELELPGLAAYEQYLENRPDEWIVFDTMCRITITRFYRDRKVWDTLRATILTSLARSAVDNGDNEVRCWSAGCGSGEEPFTLQMAWQLNIQPRMSTRIPLRIVATDSNRSLFDRAGKGAYAGGSLRHLPPEWIGVAFDPTGNDFTIQKSITENVEFLEQDIRQKMPDGMFRLVLCRNLVFTYFGKTLQNELTDQIAQRLHGEGFLIIGVHESLPAGTKGFLPVEGARGIYQRKEGSVK